MVNSSRETATEPLLSIGDVVTLLSQTYPDVTHSSLRFLEREELVTATRTQGGHRLYTASDVERIRQIKAWQRQRLSLGEIRQRLNHQARLPEPAVLSASFLRQVLDGDLDAASRTILSADDVGLALSVMFWDVLQPALVEAGDRWERGELLVAQEKEMSELTRDLIAELSRRHAAPNPQGPSVVAACVEGEDHELGLRMICGLLSAEGIKPHYLGANVASKFLLEAVGAHRPDAILLSATIGSTLSGVKDAFDVLGNALTADLLPSIVVGGKVAMEHAELLRTWGVIPAADAHSAEAIKSVFAIVSPD